MHINLPIYTNSLKYLVPVSLLLASCGGGGGAAPAAPAPTVTYTIGGAVTGLTGTGLVLRNNGGDDKSITSLDGRYTFSTAVDSGGSYNVTVLTDPSTPTQHCTVANASGTNLSANVTNADVTCVTAYTIGGTITSTSSAGVGPILQNNLDDNLFISAIPFSPTTANFTFSTPVLDTAAYSVTQLSKARSPNQNCVVTGGGSGTGSGTVAAADVTSIVVTCTATGAVPNFAYVANNTDGTVSAYTINPATGALTPATTPTVATGAGPYSVSVDPGVKFAYVVNSNADSVSAYSIDAASGTLTLIDANGAVTGNQTSIATGDFPISISIHPSGKFAYVVNQGNGVSSGNSISAYSINATTGALSKIDANDAVAGTQTTIATGSLPYAIAIHPAGKFAYVVNDTSATVSVYTINQITGALTAGTGANTDASPRSVAIDPTGQCALVVNAGADTVQSYTIDQVTGALTPWSLIATGTAPRSVAIEPVNGLFAYVANAGSGDVSAYSLLPAAASCSLNPIDADAVTGATQATIAAGTTPFSVNVDPSGAYLYVANFGSNNVSIFSIDGAGALTGSGTTTAGTAPTFVTTTE